MLGAIFGAIQAAASKAAEVTEEVGERMGVPRWITGGISGAFAAVGESAGAAKDMELPSVGGPLAMMGDKITTALGGYTKEESLPAPAVKLGRSAEIHNQVIETPKRDEFTVTMNDVNVQADLPNQTTRSTGIQVA